MRQVVFAITASACLAVANAHAATTSRLDYVRSPGAAHCPDEQHLREAVAARLGSDVFFPWATQTVLAEIVDERGGLKARIRLLDEHGVIRGTRELFTRGHDCGELAASLALAISIALDPLAAERPPHQAQEVPVAPSAPEEPRESTVEPERPPAPRVVTPPRTVRSVDTPALQRALRGGAVVAIRALPTLAAGPWLGAVVGRKHWRLGAEGRMFLSAQSSQKVTASLFTALLTACYVEGRFAACAVGAVGSLNTRGETIQGTTPISSTLDLKAGARLEYAQPLTPRFELLLSGELDRAIIANRFRLEQSVVWQVPATSAGFGLGVSWLFP